MTICLSTEEKKGYFKEKDIEYDYVNLNIVTDEDPTLNGWGVGTVKVKRAAWSKFFGNKPSDQIVGKEIRIDYFIKNGKPEVTRVSVVGDTVYGIAEKESEV